MSDDEHEPSESEAETESESESESEYEDESDESSDESSEDEFMLGHGSEDTDAIESYESKGIGPIDHAREKIMVYYQYNEASEICHVLVRIGKNFDVAKHRGLGRALVAWAYKNTDTAATSMLSEMTDHYHLHRIAGDSKRIGQFDDNMGNVLVAVADYYDDVTMIGDPDTF